MGERLMVPVQAGELEVSMEGRSEHGAVVALHPNESMHDVVPLLAEASGMRAIAVNPRGVGRSSPHRDIRDATIEGMAADLDLVRQALGYPRWVTWGMSGGGLVALAYAGWYRESIQALILDSTSASFASILADPASLLSPMHQRWRAVLSGSGAGPTGSARLDWTSVPDVGWVLRRDEGPPLLVSVREPSDQLRRVMPSLLAFDARPWLSAIRVPTLVLAGSADQVVPLAHARALHKAIPGASLGVIEDAGHVPVGDRLDDVRSLVGRFLSQRVGA